MNNAAPDLLAEIRLLSDALTPLRQPTIDVAVAS